VGLRVATLNCWNISPPFEERMALVRTELAALAPDVVGLQEIVVRGDGFDQAAVITEGLGYTHVFGAATRWDGTGWLPLDRRDGDALGNAVASRWPIRETMAYQLPGTETGETRSLVATRIETPDGVVPFFTTHLNWRLHHGCVRERQVVAVADVVQRVAAGAGLPPIVVGDMNAEPDATEIRFLCGLASLGGRSVYFQDAWRIAGDGGPGHTWDNRNPFAAFSFEPDRRIDYVLVGEPDPQDGRGRVERARLAFTEPVGGVFPSDHFGLVVDVRT
jgi:endonuclease/exonuclease/phosphatase family metal-dependent hydrolase